MALLQVNFVSQTLMRTVPIQVVLPVDKFSWDGARPEGPFPTLYLLHGIFGNYTDWVSGTRIQRWAEEHNLAVVMPSGDNRFYVDQPDTQDLYGEFIGSELVDITRRMFPLSGERANTFIGGLSMGGYGALRNGLKYHHTFGAIAALSSADIVQQIATFTDDNPAFFARRGYAQALFGPLEKLPGSDKDLRWLAQRIANPADRPRIYLACGSQDSLLPMNKNLRDSLQTLGYDLTWCEAPGAHEWDFWDSQIRRVIDWLSLGQADAGVNSGNVGV